MPGFLMHLVEGEMILNNLKKQINISKTFKEEFMLGCILPDVTSDKERTHFRPLYQKYQITKYPDMTAVYALYGLADFFSDKWFYGEYDRINPVLNRQFHPFVPDHVSYRAEDIHIKECIPNDAGMIKKCLSAYTGTAEAIVSEDQAASSGDQAAG